MLWFCQLYLSRTGRVLHAAVFVAMGMLLEVLQGMSGLRQYDVVDMLANAAGVLIGWAAATRIRILAR